MTEVRRPWRPPSLDAVAARAGVSKATASRALSPPRQGRTPQAAAAVAAAAEQLGYHRGGPERPRLLVLATDITRTGYWLTLSGAMTACQELGVDLSVQVLTGAASRWRDCVLGPQQSRIDGVVVLEFDYPSAQVLSRLPEDLPVAVAGGYPSAATAHLPRAWIDDRAGAVLAVEHLLGLGHKRIAYLGVPSAGHPDPRLAGWREVMAGAGLETPSPLATGWGPETGLRAALAAARSGVTAVLCGNDDLAIGLVTGLRSAGLEVPGDVSVVGMDDHPHAVATSPALTTVRLDFARVGEVAARLALGVEPSPGPRGVEVPVELVLRASTAAPR
ncbi:Ribose operon repressor [Actinomyces bovis]|uniref:Ribose operon repressor n=1 Tax=Actinomyces bovis TaxID=1658 RepID=A0ABY1VRI7_9ACTO|nr:substrate-binding domain-containing protein [Actinomyces bovis]SPT54443.1 Ribose operon repressor [Actinomyces bovis]VEG55952.1 Ribose operon repressor [Actinomyces israelii]